MARMSHFWKPLPIHVSEHLPIAYDIVLFKISNRRNKRAIVAQDGLIQDRRIFFSNVQIHFRNVWVIFRQYSIVEKMRKLIWLIFEKTFWDD